MAVVVLLSGPNLNLLGDREPEIYGTATLDDHVDAARARAAEHGLELEHVQSNAEGPLVDAVHGAAAGGGADRQRRRSPTTAGRCTTHSALRRSRGRLHLSTRTAASPGATPR